MYPEGGICYEKTGAERVDRDAERRENSALRANGKRSGRSPHRFAKRPRRERPDGTEKRNRKRESAHAERMKETKREQRYAHNPSYCMIRPDADDACEDVVSTSSS